MFFLRMKKNNNFTGKPSANFSNKTKCKIVTKPICPKPLNKNLFSNSH